MRTKTLLLVAAATVAGLASSMAQAVYSVNAVGYVNTTIPGNSFMMISNPLNAATNTLNALFASQVPDNFAIYIYQPASGTTPGKYLPAQTLDPLDKTFPDGDTIKLNPGQGAFVRNPIATPVTVTFVGEVPQGPLTTPLFAGFQIVSSQVPQAGTPTQLGLTGTPGDAIYQWNATTGKYIVSQFDELASQFISTSTGNEPVINVGEAFWLSKTSSGSWNRTFSVNTP
jgi:hypothetical protein